MTLTGERWLQLRSRLAIRAKKLFRYWDNDVWQDALQETALEILQAPGVAEDDLKFAMRLLRCVRWEFIRKKRGMEFVVFDAQQHGDSTGNTTLREMIDDAAARIHPRYRIVVMDLDRLTARHRTRQEQKIVTRSRIAMRAAIQNPGQHISLWGGSVLRDRTQSVK